MSDEVLDALAGVLMPGDGQWPFAAELGLAPVIRARAALVPAHAAALATVEADPPVPVDLVGVARLQRERPEAFAVLLLCAYDAYYRHPQVRALLDAVVGYPDRAPQPLGYPVPAAAVAAPAPVRRGPLWRLDGTETARRVRDEQARDPDRSWSAEDIEEVAGWPR